MSKTRSNINTALGNGETTRTGIEKTNGNAIIAVSAISSRAAELVIRQYTAQDGNVEVTSSTFTMMAGQSYNFGQYVIAPFFRVSIQDKAGQAHTFTYVKTLLYLNFSSNQYLQFTSSLGTRGNMVNDLTIGGVDADNNNLPLSSAPFNCSSYGNSMICYEGPVENEIIDIPPVIIQGQISGEWVPIGLLTTFGVSGTRRFSSINNINLSGFSNVRILLRATTDNVVCSVFSM